ncbi:MAG: hypothetical protein CBHOC_3041 [uncultured Caballeronia sp.]|nr:MAG: hypothetical protein CBHOC_3041 [uncultured Caballeronia sp.]
MPHAFQAARRRSEARHLAGGFPVEILAEPFQKPTTMLYCNFLAMEIEEIPSTAAC